MVQALLAMIYMAFISLGLPDSVLGAAWPTMYPELGVPVSYAGILSMIIAGGTILSSLCSDRVIRKWGTGLVTVISVGMTALALFGFSVSSAFWMLCLWAIPYGLGAGSVDAALNNYVAVHYTSRHMSWLHCMWGVGTVIGPYIMGYALGTAQGWPVGYRYISWIQVVLCALLFLSLPLWKKQKHAPHIGETMLTERPLSLTGILRIPGAKAVMLAFFCYCGVEQTAMLWISSYMVLHNGTTEENAALCASIFFVGITLGRLFNGFLTLKFRDRTMIRIGQALLLLGALVIGMPYGAYATMIGALLAGLGCAPIYPCLIHATPTLFGAERSQALIGIQMASAYVGTCLLPPFFGFLSRFWSVSILPFYLLLLTLLMIIAGERLNRKTQHP